ncbi:EthD family reductase [Rhizobium sp. 2YAF20]|uniref:EthD family reductase n=1 Tax=Rhizobium sp. 2YAF20 TaxID=3233027 RepID=UPI003F96269D
MIIRSGLIRNRDGVDFKSFTQHWRNVHAPLVVKIDGLRAYSQNHVLRRLQASESSALHRVDGISQLYFDDVEAMRVSMASPEQEACIVDLRGFLSDVTLLIQQAGDSVFIGDGADLPSKHLYLLHCEEADLEDAINRIRSLMTERGQSWKYRINPIIARDIVVDQSIAAGNQVVDAVFEIWTASEAVSEVADAVFSSNREIEVIGCFAVSEFVVIPQR